MEMFSGCLLTVLGGFDRFVCEFEFATSRNRLDVIQWKLAYKSPHFYCGTIFAERICGKSELFRTINTEDSMNKSLKGLLAILITLVAVSAVNADIVIRKSGSQFLTIGNDGTIREKGRKIGTIDSSGNVRKSGSLVGEVESDGVLRRSGSKIGRVQSNGMVRKQGRLVGEISSGGSIRKSGSLWGSASGCCGDEQSRRQVAAVIVFFGEFFD
ncbi:hypothetical protein OAG56_02260 [Mariniblastus sp.]|nr:hypothetical protein [Pirellulaceae bacterium]MDB4756169.1 hypothetical protein [Mariniblastus sp.]